MSAANTDRSQASCGPTSAIASLYDHLKSTDRGKHIGQFSYYHISLIRRTPVAPIQLDEIQRPLTGEHLPFNVVKLNRTHRISFLHYEPFTIPFPALLAAVSCDLRNETTRATDFTRRSNPPILHRKELLLPVDDPTVPEAERLTAHLETQGAFADTRSIGTRLGWHRRLSALGIDPDGFPSA